MDMTALDEFLTQLFDHGNVVFRSRAVPRDRPSERAVAILASAFKTHSLTVAGPRIAFDPDVACAAAELLQQSCWALVNRDERTRDLKKRLKMPSSALTPSHHLSADLVLRYVPQVLRRARGLGASDPLIDLLAHTLWRWPLTGVLSDLDEGPHVPLDFGGHSGLLLLYAERLIANDRPAWRPSPPSPAWDYYELVLEEHGRPSPVAGAALASAEKRTHGG
jgi:hypothetical protein